VGGSPSSDSVDPTYARPLPRLICRLAGHRWELVDDTEERKVRMVRASGVRTNRCGSFMTRHAHDVVQKLGSKRPSNLPNGMTQPSTTTRAALTQRGAPATGLPLARVVPLHRPNVRESHIDTEAAR
jgi:hypothetical protein